MRALTPPVARSARATGARLRRFARDEDGALVLTEFLLLLPMLVWGFIALFVYWDAFRTINESQKASYTVADLISRQGDVSTAFINGMDDVMDFMVTNSTGIRVRVTSVQWDPANDRHYVLFSRSPGNAMPRLTTAQMRDLRDRIPVMANLDGVVIIETEVDYTPAFSVGFDSILLAIGVDSQTFRNFVVTRPRGAARRICLVESMSTCPAWM